VKRLLIALSLVTFGLGFTAPVAADPAVPPPNVLLIVLDDAAPHGADSMLRKAKKRIAGQGVEFKRSFVAIPSCCPERGTLLTGQYPHNHGVRQQQLGGNLDQTRTLPADLRRAGYRTYHVGKLLHMPAPADPEPGVFDRWLISPIGNDPYWNPYFNLDGVYQRIPGYTTTITGAWARSFLQDAQAVDDSQPWYLSLNFKAPHLPAPPERKYATASTSDYWIPYEWNRSDKPAYVRTASTTPSGANAKQADMYRTMLSADDQIAATLDWLEANGEAGNTLVILTSDNGYLYGEHLLGSKFTPYTPSIRVPLWMRGPGVPAGADRERWVSGVDVAATVYGATGAVPTRVVDGESLLAPGTRSEVFVEYFQDDRSWKPVPTWASIRTAGWQYVEYYDPAGSLISREWYDLARDPQQLRNVLGDADAGNDPDTTLVAARLAAYRSCVGATCRS